MHLRRGASQRVKVFISYSRRDDAAVKSLIDDLGPVDVDVWRDAKLHGGDNWWTEILEQIRESEVFVFALSDSSLASKPCRAELGYAKALGLPILPLQVGEVANYRTDEIFTAQLVDYRDSSHGIALVASLYVCAAKRTDLPDPLPEQPPIPYQYLHRIGSSIHDPAELPAGVQRQILFELQGALDEEDDPIIREDIRNLLRALHRRKDVTLAIAGQIDTLLGGGMPPPGAGLKTRSFTSAVDATPDAADETTSARTKLPRFQRLGRRSRVMLGALAVVMVVVAVVAYLLWPPPPPLSRQIVLLTGLAYPHGVAVDSAGTVYVTDHDNNRVLELAAGASSPTTLPFTGLDWPSGVAVDSGRTVYVTDSNNNRVLKLAAGSNTADVLPFTGRFALVHPRGVAVDTHGALYVADHDNHRVLKLAAGSNTAEELPFTGLSSPAGVAVDSDGDVYVTDEGTIRVYELENLGGLYHPTDVSFPGLSDPPSGPHGVAVDSSRNVYVTDASNRVLKLAAGTTTRLPFVDLDSPGGVAVDSGGAVYVADWGHGRVLKLPPG
jgi:DNA-binding beta-propeller fold protein YncE